MLILFLIPLLADIPLDGTLAWFGYVAGALVLLGGLLIYFAIDSSAREMMERKLFF